MTLFSNMYKIFWLINYLQAATACILLEYTTVSFQGINFACMLSGVLALWTQSQEYLL